MRGLGMERVRGQALAFPSEFQSATDTSLSPNLGSCDMVHTEPCCPWSQVGQARSKSPAWEKARETEPGQAAGRGQDLKLPTENGIPGHPCPLLFTRGAFLGAVLGRGAGNGWTVSPQGMVWSFPSVTTHITRSRWQYSDKAVALAGWGWGQSSSSRAGRLSGQGASLACS